MRRTLISLFTVLTAFLYTNVKAQSWNDVTLLTKGDVRNTYDVSGKVKNIQEITYRATEKFGVIEKGDVLSVSELKYNTLGKVAEKWTTLSDSSHYLSASYKYDGNGKCIESGEYNKDGGLIHKYTYSYEGSAGNITDVSEYNKDGKLYHKWVYRYSPLGRLLDKSYYEDGHLVGSYTYKFNSQNNKVSEEAKLTNNEVEGKKVFTYDSKDKSIRVTYSTNSELERNAYSAAENYDSKGELVEFFKGSDMLIYKYTYDKQGNWTERVEYTQKEATYLPVPQIVTVRKILYW